jgi:SH3 domain protein
LDTVLRRVFGAFLLASWAFCAHAQGATRYVTDDITIVLRDTPRADGAARGVVNSGARVTVLSVDEGSGYARVRTADDREGWILQRHLKAEPVARERVQQLQKELAAAQAELKKVQDDRARLMQDFQRISGGEPIASREVIEEADRLREALADKDREVAAMREQYGARRASQRTLLFGGALVAGGALLALLVRLLWPVKKRWGDF